MLLLSSGFLQSQQFTKTVVPVLNAFSEEIGAPIYLATRDEFEVLYLAHAALDNKAISLGFGVGSRVPLLSTGIGRALLVSASQEDRTTAIAHAPLEKHTSKTIINRSDIARKLNEASDAGVVFTDGEFELGVAALAMPFLSEEPFPLALGMSAEQDAFSSKYKMNVTSALRACRNHLADTIHML